MEHEDLVAIMIDSLQDDKKINMLPINMQEYVKRLVFPNDGTGVRALIDYFAYFINLELKNEVITNERNSSNN
jgi:hypothetical protein